MIKALLGTPDLDHVGVLYVAERREELSEVFNKINRPHDVGILTTESDGYEYPKICTYSGERAVNARVLLTTKKMIEKRIVQNNSASYGFLNYDSRPRRLRIWDETFLPAKPITISRPSLQILAGELKTKSDTLYQVIDNLIDDIKQSKEGKIALLPDVRSSQPLNDILGWLEDNPDLQRTMSSLWDLSESMVRITKDRYKGHTLYSHMELLPDAVYPLAVLDASSRFRPIYQEQAIHRKNISMNVVKKYTPKDYDGLTVKLARRSSAKFAWQKHDEAVLLVGECAKAIEAEPERTWLVIHHKSVDLEGLMLDAHPSLAFVPIKFLTLGQHTATNQFSDCNGVIIAGTLHYPAPAYMALNSAASGLDASDLDVGVDRITEIARGEVRHHLYQALCRGTVRRTRNGRCGPMLAHVIASPKSGITEDAIQMMFPGCHVKPWVMENPVDRLKGKAKTAYEGISDWAKAAMLGHTLPFKRINKGSRSKFLENVRRNYQFGLALELIGVREGRFRSTAYTLGKIQHYIDNNGMDPGRVIGALPGHPFI